MTSGRGMRRTRVGREKMRETRDQIRSNSVNHVKTCELHPGDSGEPLDHWKSK